MDAFEIRSTRWLWTTLVATTAVSLAACGPNPVPADESASAFEQFQQRRNAVLAELACTRTFQCTERPPPQTPYETKQDCQTVVEDRADRLYSSPSRVPTQSLEAGRIQFFDTHVEACLDAMRDLVDSNPCRHIDSPTLGLPACERVVQGQVESDAPCRLDSVECQGDMVCKNADPSTCYGRCRPPGDTGDTSRRVRQEGQSCADPQDVCEPSAPLQCVPHGESDDRKCVREGSLSEGAKCTTNALCEPGLICTRGNCQSFEVVGAGDSCDQRIRYCEHGLACIGSATSDDGNGTCRSYPGKGDDCDTGRDCGVGLYCKTDDDQSPSEMGTCRELKAFGESCADNRCESGLECLEHEIKDEAICRYPTGTGCELPD